MMSCRQATRLMSDRQERKLTVKENVSLKLHIMMCFACQNFGKQMNVLRKISKAYINEERESLGKDNVGSS